MATITKAVLTVKSQYDAAPSFISGGLNTETFGYITLWDVRPWLPWESRGLIGVNNWEGYLDRTGVMESNKAPSYDPTTQGPKSWPLRTDTVIIYDTTVPSDTDPFTAVSRYGLGSSTVWTPTPTSPVAFDVTSLQSFLDTLVVAAYGHNSQMPIQTFPVGTDLLRIYDAYVDVTLDTAVTTRYYPYSAVAIPGGPVVKLGVPTDVLDAGNAIDRDASTYATVRETNGFFLLIFSWLGFASLWHPAILLLEKWDTYPPSPEDTYNVLGDSVAWTDAVTNFVF